MAKTNRNVINTSTHYRIYLKYAGRKRSNSQQPVSFVQRGYQGQALNDIDDETPDCYHVTEASTSQLSVISTHTVYNPVSLFCPLVSARRELIGTR